MSKLSLHSITVAATAIAFIAAVLLVPVTAEAGWKSHYDDYPGDDSPDWGKIIAIGVAGGLAIGLIAYLAKDKKDDGAEPENAEKAEKTGTEPDSGAENQSEEEATGQPSELKRKLSATSSSWNVGLYFDAEPMPGNQLGQSIDLSDDMTVGLGVSLSF